MIRPADLVARIKRLNELRRKLSIEATAFRYGKYEDPLLYRERMDYHDALSAAISGFEAARVVLVRANQRLRDQEQEQGQA